MKKYFLLILILLTAFSYGQSGIGTTTPNASTVLEVQSTIKGVMPPRVTTAQRNSITAPANGLLVYNTDINCLETYNSASSAWVNTCCSISPENPGLVRGAAGKIWMAYNLGATAPASKMDDYTQYGSLYQWGRGNDGHQLMNWTSTTAGTRVNGITNTLSATDTPGHALFIRAPINPVDWRAPQNNYLWQGVNGINNPCPAGFRVPTDAEWTAEFTAASITNITTAYASCLKLLPAGSLYAYDGLINGDTGSEGLYWSSTASGVTSKYYNIEDVTAYSNTRIRGSGLSVRCIKD